MRAPRGYVPRFVRALTAASASLVATSAFADQVVVLDETWVHTPDLADSHYRVDPAVDTPESWVSPVDYSQGTAYVYLEVHTKPTAQETRFQVCFEATPTYGCTDQSPTYTTTGTYEWSTPFADFYVPPGESVDWSQGTNRIACILKDTMNGKPSADNVGDEIAALYTPTEVRMVVTLVSPGGVYEPPTPTGEGGGDAGSGGSGDQGGGPGTGGGGDGGDGSGGEVGDGGNGSGAAGSVTSGASSSRASASSADAASSTGTGLDQGAGSGGGGEDEGGCAASPRSGGGAGMLFACLVLGSVFLRQRRRASA